MPAAIPAVVSWATAAFSTAVTATAGVLGSFGAVAALGEGATIALAGAIVKTAAVAGLTVAAAALLRPNVPSSGQTLDFKPDPKAPITGMMGYAATGGNKVFQNTWGYKGVALTLGVALSLGPIDAITRFTADDALVTFAGPEQEAVGYFDDDMWLKTTLGTPTDPHLTPPTTPKYGSPPLSGWDSTHKAPGTAFALWTLLVAKNEDDRGIFTQGVPDPRWTGRWMKVYDWRKDSTQVGGSGSQRENDWRTWEWSENPYVHARAWLRGHFKLNTDGTLDYNKRIAGVGMPPSAIDLPAFTEGANVSDANNWVISGSWSTSDQKWQVLAAMLKAGGGQPINRGAQVSVLVNTPRVSTYTYTRDDMVGQAEVQPMTRRRERKNTIVPRYRSEAHSWEYVAAKEVTSSVYRTEDRGEPRSYEVEYSYVRLPKQAAQLAAYDLVNLREGLTVTLPSKVHLMSVHAGDCITINVPDMALANQKVVVVRTITDYKNATVTLECRSETDGKHAFALGQAAEPPPSPTLSRIDPYYIPPPVADEWEAVVKPPVGSVDQPIIIVVGNPGTSDVSTVIVEYGLSATGPWISAGPVDVTTGQYQINGLNPNTDYWISIRYVANNGAISDRYITGPKKSGSLVAADISPSSPTYIQFSESIAELENAVASETLIREQQINTLTASQRLIPIASVTPGTNAADLTNGGLGSPVNAPAFDTLPQQFVIAVGNEQGARSAPLAGQSLFTAFRSIFPMATGRIYELRVDYQMSGTTTTSDGIQLGVRPVNNDGTSPAGSGTVRAPAAIGRGRLQTRARFVRGATVSGATTVNDAYGYVRPFVSGPNTAGTAAPAIAGYILTVYSMEWVDVTEEVNIRASVTTNSTAIVNLETQQALASYEVVAAASGGKPARLKLVSSSLGSAIALDAPWIYFGDNTVFDDATDTLQTTVGANRRVIAWGLPFGSAGNLLEWWGPSNIAISAMNATNGYNGRMTVSPFAFDNVTGAGMSIISSQGSVSVSRSGNGFVESGTITFTAQNAVGPVSFNVTRIAGDATIDAFPSSSTDSTAPFIHSMNFSTNLTTSISAATYLVNARDGTGKNASAQFYVEFIRL